MTPLPAILERENKDKLIVWRLDDNRFAQVWNSGEGAYRFGGRWNSQGQRAIYCALDPATAILEVAAHKGFDALDRVAHTLTAITITKPEDVLVIWPDEIPNKNWLSSGIPTESQQNYGDKLLSQHPFFVIPSAVSHHSWNLVINPDLGKDRFKLMQQTHFVLDPRLNLTKSAF